MGRPRTGCTSMVMSVQMSKNIVSSSSWCGLSWRDAWPRVTVKCDQMSDHSSMSHMTNPHFMPTTNARHVGFIALRNQSHEQKERVHQLWFRISAFPNTVGCTQQTRQKKLRSIFELERIVTGGSQTTIFWNKVKTAIDIFDERFPNSQAVFTFDNATSHQKRAPDALSARHMPKNPGWKGQKSVKNMRPGRLADGTPQSFYFPPDHENPKLRGEFKGMR